MMLLLLQVTFLASLASSSTSTPQRPWLARTLPISQRVELLLANLTVNQKIQQTYAVHSSESVARQFQQDGVGSVKFLSAFDEDLETSIQKRNQLQSDFLAASGIPISFINEGLHGGAPGGTIFPMPVNQGATWNRTLVRLIARAIAIEARAIGVDTVFAPVVNLWTDPRFGRLQEGYSENPFLTATLGMEAVLGLQHNVTTPSDYLDNVSVASLGKHYAAYGAATGGLNGGPASVDRRMLFEVYLRPWSALASVGMRACMPAHNTVLGVPCHANEYLLKDVLRERFGFRGVALSDCNDIGVLVDYRYAANASHAASLALKAGVDWDLQCGTDPEQWG